MILFQHAHLILIIITYCENVFKHIVKPTFLYSKLKKKLLSSAKMKGIKLN